MPATIFHAAASPVDLDVTILLQVAIFFVLLFLLTFLLYRPLLNLLDARTSKTEGMRAEAQKLFDETAAMMKTYTSRMSVHRKEAEAFTAELRQKVRLDEGEILGTAKGESAAMIEEARRQIKDVEGSLRRDLEPQIDGMAQSLASKILAGSANPP
jgi:F-type H+-transporting ATPase subunit b